MHAPLCCYSKVTASRNTLHPRGKWFIWAAVHRQTKGCTVFCVSIWKGEQTVGKVFLRRTLPEIQSSGHCVGIWWLLHPVGLNSSTADGIPTPLLCSLLMRTSYRLFWISDPYRWESPTPFTNPFKKLKS